MSLIYKSYVVTVGERWYVKRVKRTSSIFHCIGFTVLNNWESLLQEPLSQTFKQHVRKLRAMMWLAQDIICCLRRLTLTFDSRSLIISMTTCWNIFPMRMKAQKSYSSMVLMLLLFLTITNFRLLYPVKKDIF